MSYHFSRSRADQDEVIIRAMACDAGDHIPDATKKPSLCKWTYDEDEDKWDTECGNAFWFVEQIETPSNSGFKFCMYCGGAIKSKKEEE